MLGCYLRGISYDSAVAGELRDSWAKSSRSKSNLQKQQIESNLQSQGVKSNLLGPESNHQYASNRDFNRIMI